MRTLNCLLQSVMSQQVFGLRANGKHHCLEFFFFNGPHISSRPIKEIVLKNVLSLILRALDPVIDLYIHDLVITSFAFNIHIWLIPHLAVTYISFCFSLQMK